MSNHWPPKVLTMVDSSAMLSPQPGLPRRHTPYRPLPGLWTLAAKARICSQVGCIQVVVGRQRGGVGCQQIVDVVPGVRLELLEPAFLAPDRRLVHADGH